MLRKIIATTAVLSMVAAASASISASLVSNGSGVLSDGTTPYESWRVVVSVGAGDDWTAANITTTTPLSSGTFFQAPAPFGTNVAPDPAFFGYSPDLPLDTFYGDPGGWPNASAVGTASFAAGPSDTTTTLQADWFDLVNTGAGDFTILQMTVINGGSYTASFHVNYAAALSSGTLYGYDFTIPEPASLSLLALGGMALIRRR